MLSSGFVGAARLVPSQSLSKVISATLVYFVSRKLTLRYAGTSSTVMGYESLMKRQLNLATGHMLLPASAA